MFEISIATLSITALLHTKKKFQVFFYCNLFFNEYLGKLTRLKEEIGNSNPFCVVYESGKDDNPKQHEKHQQEQLLNIHGFDTSNVFITCILHACNLCNC